KQSVGRRKPLFLSPASAVDRRSAKGIDRDTVGDQAGVVDPVNSTDAVGHLSRYRNGKHTSLESQPMYPALVPLNFPLGKVVDGVYHRWYSAAQHVRERIVQSIGMGVHDLGPKHFHGALNPRNH